MRSATIERITGETSISLTIDLDGSGKYDISTDVGFLDHMLNLFARHGRFDLSIRCAGDIVVDDHHSVEDIGIALGQAFAKALGDKRGCVRYGSMLLPMDEALIMAAVDLSGRGYLSYEADIPTEKIGTFDTQLAEEFFIAFARNAGVTLHIRQMAGRNSHHIIEGMFKAVARSMRKAVAIDPEFAFEIPSTKGVL